MKSKKILIVLGAVAVVLLMVSSATAVPQASSQALVKKVSQVEKLQATLDEKLEILKENPNTLPIGGLFGLIIIIINVFLISFISFFPSLFLLKSF